MYIRSSYDKMIESLYKFASIVEVSETYITSSVTVLTSSMSNDDETQKMKNDIYQLCFTFGDLAKDARAVASSLAEERDRIESETQQRMGS